MRNTYIILVKKTEEKKPLGRLRFICNIILKLVSKNLDLNILTEFKPFFTRFIL